MSWNTSEHMRSEMTNTSHRYSFLNFPQKPIEIFVFIDPYCPECWSLEPFLKKLYIEYGHFFTIRPILSSCVDDLNQPSLKNSRILKDKWDRTARQTGMSCDGDVWVNQRISSPWLTSLGIKAAELQGKKAGRSFLRKIQEYLFLNKLNTASEDTLIKCARDVNIDINEFRNDLYSPSACKALQCDFKLTSEMQVDVVPTIVLFNQANDEQGLKVSGLHSYDVYAYVLQQILNKIPHPNDKPPLEEFLSLYGVVATEEISVVYDWSYEETEYHMKSLQLQQKVKKLPAKHGTFWKYIK